MFAPALGLPRRSAFSRTHCSKMRGGRPQIAAANRGVDREVVVDHRGRLPGGFKAPTLIGVGDGLETNGNAGHLHDAFQHVGKTHGRWAGDGERVPVVAVLSRAAVATAAMSPSLARSGEAGFVSQV